MKLDVTKQFSTRSDRVKGIDFHPTEPWVLITLYNGKVEIWSYATNTLVKSIQVTDSPVRSGKFIARKNWIVVGSDDFQIRVYNYNTGEKVTQFEAHADYIRDIAVHPTKPFVLTSSDDLTIKLWNWDRQWSLDQTFEGHQHYVMSVNFNPKDPNTFASACLDRTVKVWSLGNPNPNFTMLAHDIKGVNYVDYYPQADKPYLITSSDDKTVKVWDYQTKSCVATLEGHVSNVSFAIFHPELPIIVSGSEDGTLRFWNANTFKLEKSINYSLERAWCVGILPKSNLVAAGFDSGFAIIKLGNEEPLFSMDSQNKIIMAKNSDVYQSIIKPSATDGLKDGDTIPLVQKDFGTIEVYPQSLAHSPNGRYVAVCGDGEYIVYSSLAWRSKQYGPALDFAWNSMDTTNACTYATRESSTSVKIYKNFKESSVVDLVYQADKIFGGALLGVKSEGCISFYDWESGALARRVDIDDDINDIVWSADGDLLAIVTSQAQSADAKGTTVAHETYFLSYNADMFEEALAADALDAEEGAESAFDVLYTLPTSEQILSGRFVGDVFVYTTGSTNRLNYFVGGEVINLGHFDHKYYILGYKEAENTLFLIDKSFNVIPWFINEKMLVLQTMVMRGELEQYASQTTEVEGETIPDVSQITLDDISQEYQDMLSGFSKTELNQLSRFFEKLGYLGLSFALSQDFDSKFEISLQTGNLARAFELLNTLQSEQPSTALSNTTKWKKLGDLALSKWKVGLASDCYWLAKDYASLLLILSSSNNSQQLSRLAQECEDSGRYNIAYQAWWLVGNKEKCFDLLCKSKRYTEAAVFANNYNLETKIPEALSLWKKSLEEKQKTKISDRLVSDFSSLSLADTKTQVTEDLPKEKVTEIIPEDQLVEDALKEEAIENIIDEKVKAEYAKEAPLLDLDTPAADEEPSLI